MPWIEVIAPTPVLNTADFAAVFGGSCGDTIPLNSLGHPLYFEFVALPSMQFVVSAEIGEHILQIHWPNYSSHPLYIDRRFCLASQKTPNQKASVPPAKSVLQHMEGRVGTPYVWGGNWADGIPDMLVHYPPKKPIDKKMHIYWTLQGLDCSGLLFEATQGATPRNTSHLLQFGRSLGPKESLQPLDMIIYPGHVLFVRDELTIIESKFPFGVRICLLKDRLEEISQERQFISEWTSQIDGGSFFTFRRFY